MNKDINEVPLEAFQESEAYSLPSHVMVDELRNRNYVVIAPVEEDEATGLLIQDGNYFDPETLNPVSKEDAYKRASGGY